VRWLFVLVLAPRGFPFILKKLCYIQILSEWRARITMGLLLLTQKLVHWIILVRTTTSTEVHDTGHFRALVSFGQLRAPF